MESRPMRGKLAIVINRIRMMSALLWKYTISLLTGLFLLLATAHADTRDEVIFFFNDALGSAVAAVNENGELCWSEQYTAYGDKTLNEDLVSVTGCGIVGEERGFTGHTEDYNSDLVYMQQRYYDPTIGRFLSVDPRDTNPDDPNTYNRYAYANNNPYKYVDPDGEFAFLIPVAMFVAKEIVAEVASRATGGATDFLSTRRMGKMAFESGGKLINRVRQTGCSFAWDTQVLTDDGYQEIVDVEPGVDQVWSKNEQTGEMVLQPVLDALYDDYLETVYLKIVNDTNGVTQTVVSNKVHPYFVQRTPGKFEIAQSTKVAFQGGTHVTPEYQGSIVNGHWIEAVDVQVGDSMLGADDSWHSVVSVRITEEPIRAYNIDVANTDNYFVRGANSDESAAVWVHNCKVDGVPNSGKLNRPNVQDDTLKDAMDNLFRPQDKRPGGTIAELLREKAAGGPLVHLEKAKGRLKQLQNRVNDHSNPLSKSDRSGAERVINDLKDAIKRAKE